MDKRSGTTAAVCVLVAAWCGATAGCALPDRHKCCSAAVPVQAAVRVEVTDEPPMRLPIVEGSDTVMTVLARAGVFAVDTGTGTVSARLPAYLPAGAAVVRLTRRTDGDGTRLTFPLALGLNGPLSGIPLLDGDDLQVISVEKTSLVDVK